MMNINYLIEILARYRAEHGDILVEFIVEDSKHPDIKRSVNLNKFKMTEKENVPNHLQITTSRLPISQ